MYIEYRNVSLKLHDELILRNISFTVHPGDRLALIGESGAGKSSVVGLLIRKNDPTDGSITVDNTCLKDYNLSSVLRHIGYILQRPELITGNVRENVLLALDPADEKMVTDDDIWKVLDTISDTFRQRFRRYGLDTLIGKTGMQLSGGEQQRLCIARALIKPLKLLLVDEATASLDGKNQAMVQAGIDTALSQGMSAIVIAHRLSTLRNCNRFMVLRRASDCRQNESQIEAVCTSLEELHTLSPTFRELAKHEGVRF